MRPTIAIFAAATAATMAGCGNSSPTVQGSLTDTVITSKADCGPVNGPLQIVLTNASGQAIARDVSATQMWSGNACMIPFSFTNVPKLPTYGLQVSGLDSGTIWLTPAQAAQTVRLRINPDFTVSRS